MPLDRVVLHPTPNDVPHSAEGGVSLHSKGVGMSGRHPEPCKHKEASDHTVTCETFRV